MITLIINIQDAASVDWLSLVNPANSFIVPAVQKCQGHMKFQVRAGSQGIPFPSEEQPVRVWTTSIEIS